MSKLTKILKGVATGASIALNPAAAVASVIGQAGESLPTASPVRKVKAGGLAGAIAVLIIAVAAQFGVEIPAEDASAIAVAVSVIAAYFAKNGVLKDDD